VAGHSTAATAMVCVLALFVLVYARALIRLAALVSLAAAYLNNPARDASTHPRCWDALLNERRRRIAQRNSKVRGLGFVWGLGLRFRVKDLEFRV